MNVWWNIPTFGLLGLGTNQIVLTARTNLSKSACMWLLLLSTKAYIPLCCIIDLRQSLQMTSVYAWVVPIVHEGFSFSITCNFNVVANLFIYLDYSLFSLYCDLDMNFCVQPDNTSDKSWKDMGMGMLSLKCKEGIPKGTKESKPTIIIRNNVCIYFFSSNHLKINFWLSLSFYSVFWSG